MFKKIISILFALSLILTLSNGIWAAETINLGHTVATDSSYHEGALKFKELVEERTNGEVKVEVFPQSQLGWERDMLEGMQMGSVDMCISATGPFAVFVPEFELVNFPFLFKNSEHLKWFMYESSAAEKLKEAANEEGFKVLAIGAPSFRVPFGHKFFAEPSDFEGVKIRLMGVPIHRDTYNLFDANVTSMDFAELYSGLQQGVVEAGENTYNATYAMNFHEVTSHMTDLPVFANTNALVISEQTYNSLSSEYQDIIMKAGEEAWKYHDEITLEMDEEAINKMKADGMNFMFDVELTPFIEQSESIYDKYLEDHPQWVSDSIEEIKAKADEF